MTNTGHSGSDAHAVEQSRLDAFEIAGWTVDPTTNRMTSGSKMVKLEPRVMRALVYLAHRPGHTVTRERAAGREVHWWNPKDADRWPSD